MAFLASSADATGMPDQSFGHAQHPCPARAGVGYGLLHLRVGEITLDLNHLAGVDQVRVFNLSSVSLEEQRPLVRVAVDFGLRRNSP